MAQVFLSYDREDAPRAKAVAQALEKAGHSVWWDRHIKGGAQYAREIEQALKAADAVVVLWSERSVDSAWVRDEAASGRDRGRLVPVSLDGTEPPLGFRQYQTIDLGRGRMGRSHRHALNDAVGAVIGAPAAELRRPAPVRRPIRLPAGLLAATLALVVVAAGLWLWRPWAGANDEILVSVGAASGDPASRALARDVALKLGALHSSAVTPVRLVEASDQGRKADLAFEAAATGPASASLVLKTPKDSAILWSQDFEQPSGKRPDLVQQVSYTGGRIIDCAMEGLSGPVRLKPAPLKAYLNACAQLTDMGSFDVQRPVELLKQVIEASPKFEPAWGALLLSQADIASPLANEGEVDPQRIANLRRSIARARTINPTMAEADIAEAQLLPPRDFIGRTKLIEQAAERRQDDPVMLGFLAVAMSETGRLRKAVEFHGEALRLDPLSPAHHANYISLMAYSGNFDAARRELAKAEKLWPGTKSLEDAQYRFHYRYGDPRIARAIFDRNTDFGGKGPRMLLAARENPGPATIEPFMAYIRERLRNMENPSAGIGFATVAFATFDRKEELFTTLLAWPKPEDIAIIAEVFFRPEFQEERRDPRFLRIMQRAGLLDYWRKSGNWPDFCFEPGLPYDCKQDAAKLG